MQHVNKTIYKSVINKINEYIIKLCYKPLKGEAFLVDLELSVSEWKKTCIIFCCFVLYLNNFKISMFGEDFDLLQDEDEDVVLEV